jgi:hypothetical protein
MAFEYRRIAPLQLAPDLFQQLQETVLAYLEAHADGVAPYALLDSTTLFAAWMLDQCTAMIGDEAETHAVLLGRMAGHLPSMAYCMRTGRQQAPGEEYT